MRLIYCCKLRVFHIGFVHKCSVHDTHCINLIISQVSFFIYISLNSGHCKAKTISDPKTIFGLCAIFFQTLITLVFIVIGIPN